MEQTVISGFEWDLDGLAKDDEEFPVLLCTDYE